MTAAEFVYSVLLKPKPLKMLANRIIRGVLPRVVQYGPIRVVLNPTDPVISGALLFRTYERPELAFIEKSVRPGMVVLDIGANVGLYAALCGYRTGPAGRVAAFEPDPQNFRYLQETIRENSLTNVQPVQLAASDTASVTHLYTSSDNRGDNRLYANELSDGMVEVETVRLDDYLPSMGIHAINLIKMDVQGFEGHVLAGLQETIRASNDLTMMSEFWPDGLRRAGTDPVGLLDLLRSWQMALFELKNGGETQPISDHRNFVARWKGREYTNIVAVKKS